MEKRLHVMIWWLILIHWVLHCSTSCGTYEGFLADVLNMKLLNVSKFPWLVSVQDLTGSHLAVGTILSEFWIVTAPSVLKTRKDLVGVVGNRKLESMDPEKRSNYPIRKAIVHENFDKVQLSNNLMLLMTEHKIQFSRNVQPVCFPNQDPDNAAFTNCQLSGWGSPAAAGITDFEVWRRLSVENVGSCPLRRTMANECCSHRGQDSSPGYMSTEGNPVSCQVTGTDRWVLAGILTGGGMKSYGPFLYTRTSYYSDWISSRTTEEGEPFIPTITLNRVLIPAPRVWQYGSQLRSKVKEEKEALFYDYYNGNEPVRTHGHQTCPNILLIFCIVLLVV